jgi:hypothetical protein
MKVTFEQKENSIPMSVTKFKAISDTTKRCFKLKFTVLNGCEVTINE